MRARLAALLEAGDTDSLQLLEAEEEALHAGLGPRFDSVAAAMRGFDFAAALSAMRAADEPH